MAEQQQTKTAYLMSDFAYGSDVIITSCLQGWGAGKFFFGSGSGSSRWVPGFTEILLLEKY